MQGILSSRFYASISKQGSKYHSRVVSQFQQIIDSNRKTIKGEIEDKINLLKQPVYGKKHKKKFLTRQDIGNNQKYFNKRAIKHSSIIPKEPLHKRYPNDININKRNFQIQDHVQQNKIKRIIDTIKSLQQENEHTIVQKQQNLTQSIKQQSPLKHNKSNSFFQTTQSIKFINKQRQFIEIKHLCKYKQTQPKDGQQLLRKSSLYLFNSLKRKQKAKKAQLSPHIAGMPNIATQINLRKSQIATSQKRKNIKKILTNSKQKQKNRSITSSTKIKINNFTISPW